MASSRQWRWRQRSRWPRRGRWRSTRPRGITEKAARRYAEGWAEYHLARILAYWGVTGEVARSPQDIEALAAVGDVFRFKLFDRDSQMVLVSDDIKNAHDISADGANEHAVRVIASGGPVVFVEDGSNNPDRPDVYAEAYVPLKIDGKIVGVSEVYVDSSEMARSIAWVFNAFGIATCAVLLLAIMVPGALIWRLYRRSVSQNADIVAARDVAQAAERSKSQFLANMSHEIRTPRNGIIGVADLPEDTKLDEQRRSYSRVISSSAHVLLAIINDLLEFSRLEAGRVRPASRASACRAWPRNLRRCGRCSRGKRGSSSSSEPTPNCPKASLPTRVACARSSRTSLATRSSSPTPERSCSTSYRRSTATASTSCASKYGTPASAFPPTGSTRCSRRSARSTARPRANTRAPGSALPSAAP